MVPFIVRASFRTHITLTLKCLVPTAEPKIYLNLTLWRPAAFGDFREKKRLNACGFARKFLRSGMLYRPSKSLKKRSKKFFLLGGCGFFVSDIISGGLLGHLGPLCLALGTNR